MSVASRGLRNQYRRSGKVGWAFFLPWSLVALAAGLVMAVCLYLAYRWGWYYLVVAPAVAALLVAGVIRLAVSRAHCRNRFVAGLLGLVVAVLLYLGYFYVDFVVEAMPIIGPEAFSRVDLLPHFIAFRMQTDLMIDPQYGKDPMPGAGLDWFFFAADFLVVISLLVVAAVTRTSRVYCEDCRRWTRRLMIYLPSGTALAVNRALESDRLHDLPHVPAPTGVPMPVATFFVEYCRRAEHQAPCPVYLTADEAMPPRGGKGVLYQVEITAEELQGLAEKIPALVPADARARQPKAGAHAALTAITHPASPFVEPLAPEWGDPVLTTRNMFLGGAASLFPLVLGAGGIAMIGWGLWRQPWAPAPGESPWLDWILVGVGMPAAAFGAVVFWVNPDYFGLRLAYHLTRQAIRWRRGAVVNPDDPQAVFVEIIPRERWADLPGGRASDIGFLTVDTTARQLLFEGMRQRYRIPGDALASCEVESLVPVAGSFATYATVIRTHDPHASRDRDTTDSSLPSWEAPLVPRPVRFGKYGAIQRRRLPEELRDRIRQIMPDDGDSLG